MVGTVFFVVNIFKTITYTPAGWDKQPAGALLGSALGLSGLKALFSRKKPEHLVSLPVAAIARGTVDTALNAGIILFTGVLILVYMVAALLGHDLKHSAVDALLYKNWFWWGLDLIADGLVLIFVAGTWYLLAMLITGKKLYMENVARAALFVEMVVSWTVWSHHLMSDQAQPGMLKTVSGEMVTAFELITQGLAFFITLVTLWSARPLKMTHPLKFLLGGLLGFALAVPAGIMQADLGLNRILHNTQWIIGPARARGRAGRLDDDAVLGDLPAASRSSPTARSSTARSWPSSISGRTCSAASAWARSWAWRACRACCGDRCT